MCFFVFVHYSLFDLFCSIWTTFWNLLFNRRHFGKYDFCLCFFSHILIWFTLYKRHFGTRNFIRRHSGECVLYLYFCSTFGLFYTLLTTFWNSCFDRRHSGECIFYLLFIHNLIYFAPYKRYFGTRFLTDDILENKLKEQ